PPHVTSSATSRNASNSLRPQNSGTELAGPLSLPGATSTPATPTRAERRSSALRPRVSSPETTVTIAGTDSVSSWRPLAVTSMTSVTMGGEGTGEGDGG